MSTRQKYLGCLVMLGVIAGWHGEALGANTARQRVIDLRVVLSEAQAQGRDVTFQAQDVGTIFLLTDQVAVQQTTDGFRVVPGGATVTATEVIHPAPPPIPPVPPLQPVGPCFSNRVHYLFGTEKADLMIGRPHAHNYIYGLGGNDHITGGEKIDIIDGGTGLDEIYGLQCNDEVHSEFPAPAKGQTHPEFKDYSPAEKDQIIGPTTGS